jgi:hypothetical protein
VGPRSAALSQWKGKYGGEAKLKYFLPVYTWEKNGKTSFGIMGVLSCVPNCWISKCFKYVVFPKSDFYFLGNPTPATTEMFVKGYLKPDPKTWVEYSVVLYPRRNGCKTFYIYFKEYFLSLISVYVFNLNFIFNNILVSYFECNYNQSLHKINFLESIYPLNICTN